MNKSPDLIRTAIRDVKVLPSKKALQVLYTAPGLPERGTFLVYSAPGGGKTYFAGTFPKPLFIDVQGGLETVRHKKVAYVQPETYQDLLQCTISLNVEEFETIVLDTATETVRLMMDYCLKQTGREFPTLAEWVMIIEYMRRLFRALLDLKGKHIVVTCEEVTNKDEETGKVFVGPSLPGKLFHEAGALFDCLFHLRYAFNQATGKKGRFLLTEPEGLYVQAKSRYRGLSKLEVPDFPTLWEKVKEGAK